MRKFKTAYVTSIIFLCVVIGLMFSAVCAYAWKKINDRLNPPENKQEIKIDWEALYPFEPEKKNETYRLVRVFENIYNHLKDKCEDYSSKKLIGYYSIIESAKGYEEAVGWNMASVFEYNPVFKLNGNYLTSYSGSKDVTGDALATAELASYCMDRGIDFFYVNAPYKVCTSEDSTISGVLDYSNQNAEKFLDILGEYGVRHYDLHKFMHENGLNHHEAFYVADHHWKAETGLWAARHLLRILRDDYGWEVNPEILNPDNFTRIVYPRSFLGGQGKKVTLSQADPEDFTVIYPNKNIYLKLAIPDIGLNLSGDFSVFYDTGNISSKDYYSKDAYMTYCYGTRPMLKADRTDGKAVCKKLFMIRNSYSSTVIPFLAMEIESIRAVDLRYLRGMAEGSIREYIDLYRPDAVMLIYHANVPGRTSETDRKLWDLR